MIYTLHSDSVKVLDWGEDGCEKSMKQREDFEKEVAVWQKLDHPNVTKFVGASMGTSQLKIPSKKGPDAPNKECCGVVVVEFQHGGTLKTLLYEHRDRKLPYRKVVRLALDLARGLSYLHERKIMHRDVKAENMLLDRARRTLKIADFGVARVEAASEMTGQTGTLGYMAPEMLLGHTYDHKCDVYSFGILLWETYCCAMAYPNYSLADISYHVVKLVRAYACMLSIDRHSLIYVS
jgi:serine/threonine protein kinase